MEELEEAVALHDLDGTMADYEGEMLRQQHLIMAPGDPDPEALLNDRANEPPWFKARRRLIKGQPGFWRNLPVRPDGMKVLDACRHLGFTNYALTNGPEEPDTAWMEKKQWVDDKAADLPTIVGRNKGLVYGRVLHDDWPEYIDLWLAYRPRGLVVMPAHRYNLDFKRPNIVRFDGTNYAEVVARLEEARTRK